MPATTQSLAQRETHAAQSSSHGGDSNGDRKQQDVRWLQQALQALQPHARLRHDLLRPLPSFFPFPKTPSNQCTIRSLPFLFFIPYLSSVHDLVASSSSFLNLDMI
jgi:hypothetical protein